MQEVGIAVSSLNTHKAPSAMKKKKKKKDFLYFRDLETARNRQKISEYISI